MTRWTSVRERRLWTWTAIVVVTIYASLGIAPAISGFLRSEGVLGVTFAVGMLLVGSAAVAQGMSRRPGGAEIAVVLSVVAVYLLVLVRISLPEERTHLIEYGVVALLILEALRERRRSGRAVPSAPWLAIGAASAIGLVDEAIQLMLPNRVFDVVDVVFNIIAATLAVGASTALAWARNRRRP